MKVNDAMEKGCPFGSGYCSPLLCMAWEWSDKEEAKGDCLLIPRSRNIGVVGSGTEIIQMHGDIEKIISRMSSSRTEGDVGNDADEQTA